MAIYPAGNPGIYPIDATTLVGQFRNGYGDTISVPYSPTQAGFQDYENYSDDEITQFLTLGGDSINRAIGYAYLQESGAAAREGKSVQDYDLKIDLTKRAADLMKLAQFYFNLGLLDGESSFFDIVEIQPTLWPAEADIFPYLAPRSGW